MVAGVGDGNGCTKWLKSCWQKFSRCEEMVVEGMNKMVVWVSTKVRRISWLNKVRRGWW